MTAVDIQILPQILTERLLNSAAAGLILACLVWMLLRLIGRQHSAVRFAIWFSALLGIVAFPFLPRLTFARVAWQAKPGAELVLSSSWASYLFAAWIAGAMLWLSRLAIGLWRVRVLRNHCTEVDLATLDPAIARNFRALASRRRVSLCTSSELTVPAAVGLFRPAIVFPAWLLPQLSAAEIEMIVRHELAHLSRWDDWTNLIQKLVKAVFFFHPAVWWIENRLALEREMACDDIVLAQTESPRAYASSLISLAEKLHCARGLALAQALLSGMQQMSLRVAQILDPSRPDRTRLWKPVLGLAVGLLALVLGAAPYLPRLVAFQPQPSPAPGPQFVADSPHSALPDAVMSRSAVPVALKQKLALRPKAIPATFHSRSAPLRTLRTHAPHTPPVVLASDEPRTSVQATIIVLRMPQTDASTPSVSQIWTLCIWRVNENNANVRQVQSAIVVSWI